ncbi:MAG: hypothetical protein ACRDKL_11040 [Solirubrobacteraceae bacterium]
MVLIENIHVPTAVRADHVGLEQARARLPARFELTSYGTSVGAG